MFSRIQKAIDSGLLSTSLCEIIAPSTQASILRIEKELEIVLALDHQELLMSWGGSNLDEIRILSADEVRVFDGLISFANDYNGFVFAYGLGGAVIAIDTDGGKRQQLAPSISHFINFVFLGPEGAEFYGSDWADNLRSHGFA
jgi:hypothetical protein